MKVNFDLTDQVAVITGGSRGLGKEMAQAFAAHGAHVVIASRKEDSCVELAAQIERDTDRRALALRCHVGNWEDCDGLVEKSYAEFGRIDILVNNAGMSPTYSSLVDVSEELYDKVLAVNLRGPFRLSSLVATRMSEGDGGSIINISSIAAVHPTSAEIPYALAKAGLNTLTVGMAQTFAPKVRVNCIMPGAFLTDISKAWDPELITKVLADRIPFGRGGAPSEIVGAALYLASPASSYTTGAVIKVDGGMVHPPA